MKIISYNVNGIRSVIAKGFMPWLSATNADIVCLQEIKVLPEQLDLKIFEELNYETFWHPAEKKGYSGVAIFTRVPFKQIVIGCGNEMYDREGRVMRIDFEDYSILNVYMPSGSSGEARQAFKIEWLEFFYEYILNLKQTIPNLLICGDYNICHQAIDIHNPKSNANSSGFLPEEREWISKFLNSGFVDTFRHFNKEPHHYTWWSYRAGSRGKNLGWRIDYHLVSKSLEKLLKRSVILKEVTFSDHCPIFIEI